MPTITRRQAIHLLGASAGVPWAHSAHAATMQSWPLVAARRTGIHDLAPAPDGGVWFTAQRSGHLGWFDPAPREAASVRQILGRSGEVWLPESGTEHISVIRT